MHEATARANGEGEGTHGEVPVPRWLYALDGEAVDDLI